MSAELSVTCKVMTRAGEIQPRITTHPARAKHFAKNSLHCEAKWRTLCAFFGNQVESSTVRGGATASTAVWLKTPADHNGRVVSLGGLAGMALVGGRESVRRGIKSSDAGSVDSLDLAGGRQELVKISSGGQKLPVQLTYHVN